MASHSPTDVPADADEQRALATDLATLADESPEQIDAADVETAVALIEAGRRRGDYETAVAAAEVFQNLHEYPALFEPVVDDLVALSDAYPSGVEGIPAPADWFAPDELRTVVYVADALCRATQADPSIAAPHTDALCDVVFGDVNTPRHHVFTLGYAATVDPTGVPVSDLRSRLEAFQGGSHGNSYSSSAEATLKTLDEAGLEGNTNLSDIFPDERGDEMSYLRKGKQTVREISDGTSEGEETPTDVEGNDPKRQIVSRTIVENAVSRGIRTRDEAAIKAAINAAVTLGKQDPDATEFAVRQLGTALAGSDLDDGSSALADAIVDFSDAGPDAVEGIIGQYVEALTGAGGIRYAESTAGAARALAILATRLPELAGEFDEEIAGHVEHENLEVRSYVVQTLGVLVRSDGTISNAVFEALQTALDDENDAVRRAARDAAPATLTTEDATRNEDSTESESGPLERLNAVAPPTGDVDFRTGDGSPAVVHSGVDSAAERQAYPTLELLDADGVREGADDTTGEWRLLWALDSGVTSDTGGTEGESRTDTGPVDAASSADNGVALVCPECDERRASSQSLDPGDVCPDCRRGYLVEATDDGTRRASGATEDKASETTADEAVARIPDVSTARPAADCAYAALKVGERIGEGGFAEVHEAWLDDTRLALKRPKDRGTTLRQPTRDRFVEEAGTWAKLDDDPHVVTMVDWGETPWPWIAMEYLDGGDLRARLDGADGFDAAERLWVAAVLAETVANVHHLGVRHLDLKPANVLFQRSPGDEWAVPKIGDWGVAERQIEADESAAALTPAYAAPEQFASEPLDHQTDIYQLGALCYELLTGRTPAEEGVDAANPETSRRPRPPSTLRPALPERVDEALLRALALEKRERYDSAVYLRDALWDAFHDVVKGAPDVRP